MEHPALREGAAGAPPSVRLCSACLVDDSSSPQPIRRRSIVRAPSTAVDWSSQHGHRGEGGHGDRSSVTGRGMARGGGPPPGRRAGAGRSAGGEDEGQRGEGRQQGGAGEPERERDIDD